MPNLIKKSWTVSNIHPFNLHPNFYRVPPEIVLVWHLPRIFFQAATLKKNWLEATVKKSQVAPYKNLGRFSRVHFKSLLRVQIERAIVAKPYLKAYLFEQLNNSILNA